jgi:hypothetical protein
MKNYINSYIKGDIDLDISKCRLFDIHNEIEDNSDKYDEFHLALLKYERYQLVRKIFKK